jgi:nucleotide-binding universal stress UspA family protein
MIRENALQRMQEALNQERLNLKCNLSLVEDNEGGTHRTIVRFAESSNADLLLLNLHSKTFLERAMLGATAERVIRTAKVPVLSLPAHTTDRYMKAVETAATS